MLSQNLKSFIMLSLCCIFSGITTQGSQPSSQYIPASIFFCIDHSGSMTGPISNDRWGVRFSLTRAIIDTLKKNYPEVEVGLSVFRQYLYFDPVDDSRFVQCPQQDTGAYLPLFQLDSSYAPDGKEGSQILLDYLETDTIMDSAQTHVILTYEPMNGDINMALTNINSTFDAARHAMESSSYEKDRHFIFIFSDGVASYPQDSTQEDYIQGKDLPTTFTFYFTNDSTVPVSIQDMNENIKANGYSVSNPLTNLWSGVSDFDSLLSVVNNDILPVIFGPTNNKFPQLSKTLYSSDLKLSTRFYNGKMQIYYSIHKSGHISIGIFNLQGRLIYAAVNGYHNAGKYAIKLSTGNKPSRIYSGCYIIRLQTADKSISKTVHIIP